MFKQTGRIDMGQSMISMEFSELDATADKVRLLARRIRPIHPDLVVGQFTGRREDRDREFTNGSVKEKVNRTIRNKGSSCNAS
ncbi:MAG: hypothetical protein ABFD44_02575 [Anaerolineaceae bacterium]